ncbi:MAG: hypothetical protein AAF740_03400 [Bacteroidota bacterium]
MKKKNSNTFTDIFLRAKHWQIFSLTTLLPAATVFAIVWWFKKNYLPDIGGFANQMEWILYLSILPLVVIPAVTQFGWLWSVVIGLQARVKEQSVRMNTAWFKVFFFFPFLVFGAVAAISWWYGREMMLMPIDYEGLIPIAIGLVMLFNQFCLIAIPYCAAKSIKVAEKQGKVSFWNPIGTLFLILIFPIGIWFLQPRINRLV